MGWAYYKSLVLRDSVAVGSYFRRSLESGLRSSPRIAFRGGRRAPFSNRMQPVVEPK